MNNTLKTTITGAYEDGLALANLTIAGLQSKPQSVTVYLGGKAQSAVPALSYEGQTLRITNLDKATQAGVWSADLEVKLNYESASSYSATSSWALHGPSSSSKAWAGVFPGHSWHESRRPGNVGEE